MTRPIEDTEPWYRQFWPWFLIALPATVVVAAFTTLYIANRHSDDVVVADYYKEGLAINRRLARNHLAEQLGISAELQAEASTITVRLSGEFHGSSLRLYLSHPMEADRDQVVMLSRAAPGLYQGQLPSPLQQRMHWRLESQDEDGWSLDGTLSPAQP